MSSEAVQVKDFTEGASQVACPNSPSPMSQEEAKFVVRMALSELVELAQTVFPTDEEALDYICSSVTTDLSKYQRTDDPDQLAADQADAGADVIYYLYNCFAKKGINLSSVFQVVHQANMAKRDPETGEFRRRPEDGKILKPPGWAPPDILAEIRRQKEDGSWN